MLSDPDLFMLSTIGIVDNYHQQTSLAHNNKTRSNPTTTTAMGTPRTLLPPSHWRTSPPRNRRTTTLLTRCCTCLPHKAYTRLSQLSRQQWVFRTCRRTSWCYIEDRSNSPLGPSPRNPHCSDCLALQSTILRCRRAHPPRPSSTNHPTPCR